MPIPVHLIKIKANLEGGHRRRGIGTIYDWLPMLKPSFSFILLLPFGHHRHLARYGTRCHLHPHREMTKKKQQSPPLWIKLPYEYVEWQNVREFEEMPSKKCNKKKYFTISLNLETRKTQKKHFLHFQSFKLKFV
uniref:Uncharacterized protein n=1 Tax=Meloidogyne hapla TaxID=6305 RepID=A0A1I8B6E6_MELHA